MCSSSPGSPKVTPAPVAPAIVAPIEADTSVKEAGDQERRRRQAAFGRSDTILSGPMGVTGVAPVGGRRLLGG